jgi:hypothetical protein
MPTNANCHDRDKMNKCAASCGIIFIFPEMPHTTKPAKVVASFSGVDALIKKIRQDGKHSLLLGAIETFEQLKRDTQTKHKTLCQQRAEMRREMQRLKEELEANDRELTDLKVKAEEDCKEFKYALSMVDRLQASLRGERFECTICQEKLPLSGIVACPSNHQVCLACFDRLESKEYRAKIINKKYCPLCRHLFATVETDYPHDIDTDPFPLDTPLSANPFPPDSPLHTPLYLDDNLTDEPAGLASPLYSPHDFESQSNFVNQ